MTKRTPLDDVEEFDFLPPWKQRALVNAAARAIRILITGQYDPVKWQEDYQKDLDEYRREMSIGGENYDEAGERTAVSSGPRKSTE